MNMAIELTTASAETLQGIRDALGVGSALSFGSPQSLTAGQTVQALDNIAFPTYPTLASANATEMKIGVPFYNTTTNEYESTTDIS